MKIENIEATRFDIAADVLNAGISGDVLKAALQAHLSQARDNAQSQYSDDDFLSIPQAAKLLSITRRHVYNLVKAGKLPAVRISERTLRVPMASIRKLQANAERSANSVGV